MKKNSLWESLEINFANFLLGDINFDNQINIQDVIFLVNIILDNIPNQAEADLNQDNLSDILDILILINLIID